MTTKYTNTHEFIVDEEYYEVFSPGAVFTILSFNKTSILIESECPSDNDCLELSPEIFKMFFTEVVESW